MQNKFHFSVIALQSVCNVLHTMVVLVKCGCPQCRVLHLIHWQKSVLGLCKAWDWTLCKNIFVSLTGVYYCFNMVIIMIAVFLSSLVVNLCRDGEERPPVPRWLKLVCILSFVPFEVSSVLVSPIVPGKSGMSYTLITCHCAAAILSFLQLFYIYHIVPIHLAKSGKHHFLLSQCWCTYSAWVPWPSSILWCFQFLVLTHFESIISMWNDSLMTGSNINMFRLCGDHGWHGLSLGPNYELLMVHGCRNKFLSLFDHSWGEKNSSFCVIIGSSLSPYIEGFIWCTGIETMAVLSTFEAASEDASFSTRGCSWHVFVLLNDLLW